MATFTSNRFVMIRLFALLLLVVVLSSFGVSMLNCSSLVAYYPMTQQTGNVLLDMKGGDKLVGQGNPYIVNASAYCSGITTFYESENQSAFKKLTNQFTISFWAKRNTISSASLVIALDIPASLNVWNIQNTSGGNFQMVIVTGITTTSLIATGFISAGIWRHFVGVYDGTQGTASDRIKLYVNGININGTMSGTIPTTLQNPANTTVRIGKGIGTVTNDSYMKFIELYNRPLTPTEVKNIYVEEYNKIQQSRQ